jgi:hypothetical protein
VKEGAQVDGALGPEHPLELLLRLGPFLYRLAEASCTGLGQPQRLAPAITAPPLDGDQTVTLQRPLQQAIPLSGLLIERCPSVRRAKVDARDKSGRSIRLDHRHC